MIVDLQTGEIIALSFSNGKKHDFQLFKDSRIHVKAETVLEADSGYQGLAQIHANSLLPKKRSKNHSLTKQERKDMVFDHLMMSIFYKSLEKIEYPK